MQLKHKDLTVTIDAGELVGFTKEDKQYIHQKGTPGWGSSDTEMFPIIGPTANADFKVKTPRGEAVMDQHGLYRELTYSLKAKTETTAVYEKSYTANTKVKNSKFPKKSTEEWLHWPYDFKVEKHFELSDDNLKIYFKIYAADEMPYMLGYHPAFNLETDDVTITANGKTITLADVMAVGDRAYHVANCSSVILQDSKKIEITSEGFGDFMLWSPTPNMICIEPITFYPYAVNQLNLNEGFRTFGESQNTYSLTLKPL